MQHRDIGAATPSLNLVLDEVAPSGLRNHRSWRAGASIDAVPFHIDTDSRHHMTDRLTPGTAIGPAGTRPDPILRHTIAREHVGSGPTDVPRRPGPVEVSGPIERILAVSDLHLHPARLDWVIDRAERYDLLVVAGDTLDTAVVRAGDPVEINRFIERLADRTRVAICSGNHDLDSVDSHGERVCRWISHAAGVGVAVDGDVLLTPELSVSVCGWWDGPVGAERLRRQVLDHERLAGERRRIWVHHAPVADSPIAWDGRRDRGDRHLARLVDDLTPDIVISGHVHQAPFADGGDWHDRRGSALLLNPGQPTGGRPAAIEIDLAADTATWHSSIGSTALSETIPLTPPAETRSSGQHRVLSRVS